MECPEAHVITFNDTDHDYQPALCAAFGADGPRRESACVWTNANVSTDDYDLEGGIYMAAELPLGEVHCSSVPNSSGLRSEIWATGSPFISDRDITLWSYTNPSNVVGLFFFGTSSI